VLRGKVFDLFHLLTFFILPFYQSVHILAEFCFPLSNFSFFSNILTLSPSSKGTDLYRAQGGGEKEAGRTFAGRGEGAGLQRIADSAGA
jgi:hypothetical protein